MADYTDFIDNTSEKYGIPKELAHALIRQESGGKQSAISDKGATGIMQLMPGTAKELGVDINDPYQNIEGGLRYYKQAYEKFGNHPQALAAYNAGPNNRAVKTKNWKMLPNETKGFVTRILNFAVKPASANETPYQAPKTDTTSNDEYTAIPLDSVPNTPNKDEYVAIPLDEASPVINKNDEYTAIPIDGSNEPNPSISTSESFLRGAGQGVTFGLQDEASAALEAGMEKLTGLNPNETFSEKYNANKQNFRALNKKAEEANPGNYLGGNIAGGLVIPMGKIKTIKDVVKLGSIYGGTTGFGNSEANNTTDLLTDTATGAAIGTTLGLVPKVGAKIIGYGGGKAADVISKVAGKNTPKLDLAESMGIPVTNLDRWMNSVDSKGKPNVMTQQFANWLNEYAGSIPFVRNAEARINQADKLDKFTLKTMNNLNPHNLDPAESAVQSLNEGLKGKKEVVKDLYDHVSNIVNRNALPEITPTNTHTAITEFLDKSDILNRFPDTKVESLFRRIGSDANETFSFGDARDIRGKVGDYLRRSYKSAGQVGSNDIRLLQKVKVALDDDINHWATNSGNDELIGAYREANQTYQDLMAPYTKNLHLQKVNQGQINTDNVFKTTLGGGPQQTKTMVGAMGKVDTASGDVVQGVEMVKHQVLKQAREAATDADGNFHPIKFAASLDKIGPDKLKSIFVNTNNNFSEYHQIKGIRDVSRVIGKSVSNTLADPKNGNRLAKIIISGVGFSAVGATGVVPGAAAGYVLNKLLTDPRYNQQFLRVGMAKGGKIAEKVSDEMIKQLIKQESFQLTKK